MKVLSFDCRVDENKAPFQTPSELTDQVKTFDNNWKKNNDIDFNPYIIDNNNSIRDGFDFTLYNNLVPDARGTALHCFS